MTKEYIIVNGVPILRSLIAETAKELPYDNTKSQLAATNSQDAIDEINGKINSLLVTTKTSISVTFTANAHKDIETIEPKMDGYICITLLNSFVTTGSNITLIGIRENTPRYFSTVNQTATVALTWLMMKKDS